MLVFIPRLESTCYCLGMFSQGHQIPQQKLNQVYLILKNSILYGFFSKKNFREIKMQSFVSGYFPSFDLAFEVCFMLTAERHLSTCWPSPAHIFAQDPQGVLVRWAVAWTVYHLLGTGMDKSSLKLHVRVLENSPAVTGQVELHKHRPLFLMARI